MSKTLLYSQNDGGHNPVAASRNGLFFQRIISRAQQPLYSWVMKGERVNEGQCDAILLLIYKTK